MVSLLSIYSLTAPRYLYGTMSSSKSVDESDPKHGISNAWTETQTVVAPEPQYFVKNLEYTAEEEAAVVRTLDTRLFPVILLTTFVLNMDRTNNSNAYVLKACSCIDSGLVASRITWRETLASL